MPVFSSSPPDPVEAITRLPLIEVVLETVCDLTGMRFAAVARVTDSAWTACAVLDRLGFGLKPGDELKLDSTICDEIRTHHQPVIFGHASQHPIFSTHHTPRLYGLESYVSVPIIGEDGSFFGTLCAIDSEPRNFDEGTVVRTLTLFASLIASQLRLEVRAADAEGALQAEVDNGMLRETFFAIAGHDLRSPLQSARLVADELLPLQQTERGTKLVGHLIRAIDRMSGLVGDVMDFARGRLGGGVHMRRIESEGLEALVRQAIEEVSQGHPTANITLVSTLSGPVFFDGERMRQLLANLLNNAVTHGDPAKGIQVRLGEAGDQVALTVLNFGSPIPAEDLGQIFDPFTRPEDQRPRPGLGLGLFIAAEIAKGHGGTLTVTSSTVAGTAFVLNFPRATALSSAT